MSHDLDAPTTEELLAKLQAEGPTTEELLARLGTEYAEDAARTQGQGRQEGGEGDGVHSAGEGAAPLSRDVPRR